MKWLHKSADYFPAIYSNLNRYLKLVVFLIALQKQLTNLLLTNTTKFFQGISYLQYPCMAVAIGLILYSMFTDVQTIFHYFNHALVFIGLGISFSTLQDTTTTHNEISRRVWEDPVKGKRMITLSSISTFIIIFFGIFGLFSAPDSIIRQLSIGFIAFGIGLVGMLKAMVEMFENHRADKNPKRV